MATYYATFGGTIQSLTPVGDGKYDVKLVSGSGTIIYRSLSTVNVHPTQVVVAGQLIGSTGADDNAGPLQPDIVLAPSDGYISGVEQFDNFWIITFVGTDGKITRFTSLTEVFVASCQAVKAGDIIGYRRSGNYIWNQYTKQQPTSNAWISGKFRADGAIGVGVDPQYALHVVSGEAIAASFDGRVRGVDAVNDDEFITKGQLPAPITFINALEAGGVNEIHWGGPLIKNTVVDLAGYTQMFSLYDSFLYYGGTASNPFYTIDMNGVSGGVYFDAVSEWAPSNVIHRTQAQTGSTINGTTWFELHSTTSHSHVTSYAEHMGIGPRIILDAHSGFYGFWIESISNSAINPHLHIESNQIVFDLGATTNPLYFANIPVTGTQNDDFLTISSTNQVRRLNSMGYIWNQFNSAQTIANWWISGSGRATKMWVNSSNAYNSRLIAESTPNTDDYTTLFVNDKTFSNAVNLGSFSAVRVRATAAASQSAQTVIAGARNQLALLMTADITPHADALLGGQAGQVYYNATGSILGTAKVAGYVSDINLASGNGKVINHLAGFYALRPFQANSQTAYTGTVINYYGVYIDDAGASDIVGTLQNRYGIYQAGATDINRFNGHVELHGLAAGTGDFIVIDAVTKRLRTASSGSVLPNNGNYIWNQIAAAQTSSNAWIDGQFLAGGVTTNAKNSGVKIISSGGVMASGTDGKAIYMITDATRVYLDAYDYSAFTTLPITIPRSVAIGANFSPGSYALSVQGDVHFGHGGSTASVVYGYATGDSGRIVSNSSGLFFRADPGVYLSLGANGANDSIKINTDETIYAKLLPNTATDPDKILVHSADGIVRHMTKAQLGIGGSTSLTSTYIGYGNSSNQLSGSQDLTYEKFGASGDYVNMRNLVGSMYLRVTRDAATSVAGMYLQTYVAVSSATPIWRTALVGDYAYRVQRSDDGSAWQDRLVISNTVDASRSYVAGNDVFRARYTGNMGITVNEYGEVLMGTFATRVGNYALQVGGNALFDNLKNNGTKFTIADATGALLPEIRLWSSLNELHWTNGAGNGAINDYKLIIGHAGQIESGYALQVNGSIVGYDNLYIKGSSGINQLYFDHDYGGGPYFSIYGTAPLFIVSRTTPTAIAGLFEFTDVSSGGYFKLGGAASADFLPVLTMKGSATFNSAGMLSISITDSGSQPVFFIDSRLSGGPIVNQDILHISTYANTRFRFTAAGNLYVYGLDDGAGIDRMVTVNNGVLGKTSVPAPNSYTYTPTLTNTTNITSSTAYALTYTRVGNAVAVSGMVTITPTVAWTQCSLGITIPIASTFGQIYHASGNGVFDGDQSTGAHPVGSITVDKVDTSRVALYVNPTTAGNPLNYMINFMYIIL